MVLVGAVVGAEVVGQHSLQETGLPAADHVLGSAGRPHGPAGGVEGLDVGLALDVRDVEARADVAVEAARLERHAAVGGGVLGAPAAALDPQAGAQGRPWLLEPDGGRLLRPAPQPPHPQPPPPRRPPRGRCRTARPPARPARPPHPAGWCGPARAPAWRRPPACPAGSCPARTPRASPQSAPAPTSAGSPGRPPARCAPGRARRSRRTPTPCAAGSAPPAAGRAPAAPRRLEAPGSRGRGLVPPAGAAHGHFSVFVFASRFTTSPASSPLVTYWSGPRSFP